MSMTRERAAEWFETHMPTGRVKPVQKQAYLMALSALRPVSREQALMMDTGADPDLLELADELVSRLEVGSCNETS